VGDGSAELSNHAAGALVARWAEHLQHDRRRSPHTVRAYVATGHRFIGFLGGHLGTTVGPEELHKLSAADLRAFLARRRGEGLGASSAARELSGAALALPMAPHTRTLIEDAFADTAEASFAAPSWGPGG